jgi:hypothetical protein
MPEAHISPGTAMPAVNDPGQEKQESQPAKVQKQLQAEPETATFCEYL